MLKKMFLFRRFKGSYESHFVDITLKRFSSLCFVVLFLCFRDRQPAWCPINPSTKAWEHERLLRKPWSHKEGEALGSTNELPAPYRQAVSTKVWLIIGNVCLMRDGTENSTDTCHSWVQCECLQTKRRLKAPTETGAAPEKRVSCPTFAAEDDVLLRWTDVCGDVQAVSFI